MKKIVLITGGFDPLHSGHLSYIREAKKLGDILVVGVNSDEWLSRKKGRAFMPYMERANVVRNIVGVDFVIDFNDDDNTAKHAIHMVRQSYPGDTIVFANGGDRTDRNIPEMDYADNNIEFVFGTGGYKKENSSSWILEEWKAPKTKRPWGYYRVLHEVTGTKVKELTVLPGHNLSMQKHSGRSEYWHVSHGACVVLSSTDGGYQLPPTLLKEHQSFKINKGDWHQLTNPYEVECKIVEIQYGERCEEEDIERK